MISRIVGRLDAIFSQRSRNAVLLSCLAVAVALGVLDDFTKMDLLVLYLVPVIIAAWYGGARAGYVVAIYCAGAAFVWSTVISRMEAIDVVAAGTFLVRLATYLIVSKVVSRLRLSQQQQRELTGFIVHDLRSPISSAITGLLTLEQTADSLDEVEKEMVALALVSNQRALNLVNSILDVSKLESGKMPVSKELILVEDLVDECVRQVALWAKSNEIEIVRDIQEPRMYCDPSLTGRVIVNLLSNALKFSPPGSRVLVQTVHVRDSLRLSVKDQGPGIPEEYAEAIFEPFSQIKGTKGGTGLGLTFCRLAIQAQGGRIWVESQVGKGTSMLFSLPSTPHLRPEEKSQPALEV